LKDFGLFVVFFDSAKLNLTCNLSPANTEKSGKVDFDLLAEQTFDLKVEDAFCTLGTTIAKAGSQRENFFA
jgi:hypothetical protein